MKKMRAYIILGGFLLFLTWQGITLYNTTSRLALVQNESDERAAQIEALDANVEKLEETISLLEKDGFVEKQNPISISEKIFPSVVFILAKSANPDYNSGNRVLMEGEFNIYGTGFFITPNGYIATARHIVSELSSSDIKVEDFEGTHYEVEKITLDENADIAVIKIKTNKKHPAVTAGYFENIEVGEEVGLIGFNPGFRLPLLHTGAVSSKGVDKEGERIFTINSFANKGNSGSPVFSLTTGRVLGILSARKSDVQTHKLLDPNQFSSGVSFGNVGDPAKLSAELYNETVKIVQEVSQVGIGIVYSLDIATTLTPQRVMHN